jgi:hypothetical protein
MISRVSFLLAPVRLYYILSPGTHCKIAMHLADFPFDLQHVPTYAAQTARHKHRQ